MAKRFALVNGSGIAVDIGTRAQLEASGWGHNRELVELVAEHKIGDLIEYNERGVEVLPNLEPPDDTQG